MCFYAVVDMMEQAARQWGGGSIVEHHRSTEGME